MHNFRKLVIWQKGIELSKEIYSCTKDFPSDERFGLISQLRRASISVPSNIAEGSGRKGEKEMKHFCQIATGSLCEIETQLIVSKELSLLTEDKTEHLINKVIELRKMIYGFISKLN